MENCFFSWNNKPQRPQRQSGCSMYTRLCQKPHNALLCLYKMRHHAWLKGMIHPFHPWNVSRYNLLWLLRELLNYTFRTLHCGFVSFHPACTWSCGFVIYTNCKKVPTQPRAAESPLVFNDPLEAAINTAADKRPSLSAASQAHICGHAAMMETGLNWRGGVILLPWKQRWTAVCRPWLHCHFSCRLIVLMWDGVTEQNISEALQAVSSCCLHCPIW